MSQRRIIRETNVRHARRVLGDERALSFLRALNDAKDVLACELVTAELGAGKGLDSIFYTGEETGFTLAARAVAENVYDVEFGCVAGPDAGDGGRWTVRFDDGCVVVKIEATEQWVA